MNEWLQYVNRSAPNSSYWKPGETSTAATLQYANYGYFLITNNSSSEVSYTEVNLYGALPQTHFVKVVKLRMTVVLKLKPCDSFSLS